MTSPPTIPPPRPGSTGTSRPSEQRSKLRPDDGRLVRGRRSRERIREAARELFRERGFDAATLRAIAERAGMGASSIYRHVQSKEELLVDELAALQEEAWQRFRTEDDRKAPTRDRVRNFLEVQHELLVADRDLTTIALRATTKPEARVARRVLALHDRTIGLLAEILQLFYLRHLVFDPIPYVEFHQTNHAYLLALWIPVIVCLILGAFLSILVKQGQPSFPFLTGTPMQ